jgi:energy-coupling factor transport system ATP-binding protein
LSVLLDLNEISFRYPHASDWLFQNLTVGINRGSITAITGPNGSGKTTLLYTMCGIIPNLIRGIFKGNVCYSNNDLRNFTLPQISQWMNILQQDPDHQLAFPIVEQELSFGVENLCVPSEEIRKRINQIIIKLGLEELLQTNTSELSYGQKKLVALSSLLVMDSPTLLLDEPSAGLDEQTRNLLKELILELSAQGKTIILADHVPDLLSIANTEIQLSRSATQVITHAV